MLFVPERHGHKRTDEMDGSCRDNHCTSTIVWGLAAAVVRLADLTKLRQVRF